MVKMIIQNQVNSHLLEEEDIMNIVIKGIPTSQVIKLRNGGMDSHGNPPKVHRAQGLANPCRHCLQLIKEGEPKLVLAHMPFPKKHPYAEVGPVFLHQEECGRYVENSFPDWFVFLEPAILRGYDNNDWIIYETGAVVAGSQIENECINIFKNKDVKYIHVRSKYNCYQCKVEKA